MGTPPWEKKKKRQWSQNAQSDAQTLAPEDSAEAYSGAQSDADTEPGAADAPWAGFTGPPLREALVRTSAAPRSLRFCRRVRGAGMR